METRQIMQMDRKDVEDFISSFVAENSEAKAYEKFYNVLVPSSWISVIHSISYQTVFRYIQRGLIVPEERQSRDEKYQFRLSEVLKMDFKKLQKQLRRERS